MKAVAQEARDVLTLLDDGNSWCKHSYTSEGPDGGMSYCIAGAVHRATTPGTSQHKLLGLAIMHVIEEQFPDSGIWITAFNDNPETTWEDVRMVLEKVIAREEEKA
jgi:hypothetical protein